MGCASPSEAAGLVHTAHVCPWGLIWRCPGHAAGAAHAIPGTIFNANAIIVATNHGIDIAAMCVCI